MEYILDGVPFSFSYKELKDRYHTFVNMSDEEFLENIVGALHFACFTCFVKEIPGYVCLADNGIVHELIHVLESGPKGSTASSLEDVRNLFKEQLRFA